MLYPSTREVEIEAIVGLPKTLSLPDHSNQPIPLPVFDHSAIVDAGFLALFREYREILGISIGRDADPCRRLGYPEA